MKSIMKLISVVLVFCLLIGTVAFAAEFTDVNSEQRYYEPVKVLSGLKIVNGYEDGTFGPEKDVTRAEFSTMLMRAMASAGIGSSDPSGTPFTDLGDASWAISDVRTAYDLGIINGMTTTTFEPNSKVTYEQALKMLVCALNYGAQAEEVQKSAPNMPWYYGYTQVANTLKLTGGFAMVAGSPAKRWEIAQMIYNALEVKMLKKVEINGGGVMYQQSDDTFLGTKLGLVRSSGEVYADGINTLAPDGATARDGYALIHDTKDNKVYTLAKGDVSLNGLVGKSMDYYYKHDMYGDSTLVYVLPRNSSTSSVVIDAKHINLVRGTHVAGFTISYYESDTATRPIEVTTTANPTISRNGEVITTATSADLEIETGTIELINTGAGYSKINVSAYETYVVKSVNSTDKYIVDVGRTAPDNTLSLDDTNGNSVITLKNTSNNDVTISGISQYNVLTVKKSKGAANRTIYDIVVSNKNVTGTIKGIDLADMVIDVNGKQYAMSPYFTNFARSILNTLSVGDTCKFFLDKDERIAYAQKTSSNSSLYGYISGVGINGDELRIAIISSKVTKMGSPYLVAADKVRIDGDLITDKNVMMSKLEASANLPTANVDKTRTDNKTMNAQYSQLVKYSVNSSGQINSIDTAFVGPNEDATDETTFKALEVARANEAAMKFTYASSDFTGNTTNPGNLPNKFRINSSTQVFLVPRDRSNSSAYARKSQGFFKTDFNYIVEPYDVSGTLNVAKAVVVYESSGTINKIDYKSPMFIITGITQGYNKDGNEADVVTGYEISYTGGITDNKTLYTDSIGIISNGYAIGDVISYSLNNDGYIQTGNDYLRKIFTATGEFVPKNDVDIDTVNAINKHSAGLLIGSDIDGAQQMFVIAIHGDNDYDNLEGTPTKTFVSKSGTKYFTYDSTITNGSKVVKQEGVLDLSSYPSYEATKDTGTPTAAKIFLFTYEREVKMVYVMK